MPDFLYLWHSETPAAQPPDAAKVERALQAAIENPVIRLAVAAGAVDDVAVNDAISFLDDEGRNKAVGAVEERQFPEDVRMDRLQATAGVAGLVMQDGLSQPIGETGRQLLDLAVAALQA